MDLVALLNASASSGERLNLQLRGLGRLLDTSRALAAEVDLARAVELLTEGMREAIDCEQANLFEYDAQHDSFNSPSAPAGTGNGRAAVGNWLAGQAAHERRVVNLDQADGDVRSGLAAPVCSPTSHALLGVLELLNKRGGSFDRFDECLLDEFGRHAAVALERARLIDDLQRVQATEASLAVARDVQRSFMPRELPSIPGYEIATWWYPNAAVGGDYCDVVPMCDRRLGVVIADVSGHGLGPSLLMASVRAALRALMLEHSAPEILLDRLSRALYGDLKDGLFITMLFGALDVERHRLEYSNAGHAPAEHFCALTNQFMPFESTGLPLGVLEDSQYPQGPALMIEPGDVVVLCTDGIIEAMDATNRPFGRDQLRQIIAAHHQKPAKELIKQIADRVAAHYVGENPDDDLTILTLRRLP
ncbi:MAG: SpoIIE family protein phosphatase [Planctomycetes bacterium]|nr:SpoIIE family protein phosphatase [Planctomycetota bacterium]